MSESAVANMPPPAREQARKAAIVGIGESDFHLDYKASRANAPGYEKPTPEALARIAFERALADSGLSRDEIDGVSVSFLYGGPEPSEMASLLGLTPKIAKRNGGIMAGPLPVVCADIAAGRCDTVAMIYAVASRAIGRQYGGATYAAVENMPTSYYYYHPWGWSSQAAHWALIAQAYHDEFGTEDSDLGAVAMQVRAHAAANSNAVMQTPFTIDEYLQSRHVVRPLRLLDLCLVNDGAVCIIVHRSDLAKNGAQPPVHIAGWGESKVKHSKLDHLVRQRLRPQLQDAGKQALDMAGLALSEIQHFEGYDVSTIHLASQVEGYGFVAPGAALRGFKEGRFARDGALPVNSSGGMLSESYTHGWSQIVEITRQLRGASGARQIKNLRASMFSLAQTDQAHPLILTRED